MPVFDDGKIVFNAGSSLYILDAASGNELAKITHAPDSTKKSIRESYYYHDSSVAVSGGIAYFIAPNGDLGASTLREEAPKYSV
ncbi:MAG: hypothetical protein LBH95_10255 [Oscillospiraceae bacterium]|nr:hypothetical protein [Oscillospiraceae bacterium]